jgi:YHS domain-containing protein
MEGNGMMTRLTLTVLAAVLFGLAATAQDAEEKKPELKEQTVCPVMGGKINKSSFVDHEGQRIYVCCAGCIAPLKKDPTKYIKKLAEKGEAPAKLQTTCPVMGGKINTDQYVDHDGKRIYVCCAGCIGAIKADPAKYVEKLKKDGITLYDVPKSGKKKGKDAAD